MPARLTPNGIENDIDGRPVLVVRIERSPRAPNRAVLIVRDDATGVPARCDLSQIQFSHVLKVGSRRAALFPPPITTTPDIVG